MKLKRGVNEHNKGMPVRRTSENNRELLSYERKEVS